MKNEIFISLLIVAFFNYISGCSFYSNKKIVREKLEPGSEKIIEAVLVNLDVIQFDKSGGRYSKLDARIQGKTASGVMQSIPVEQIRGYRVNLPPSVEITDSNRKNIKEIILANNSQILPDKNGCYFSPDGGNFICTDIAGETFTTARTKVAYAYTENTGFINTDNLKESETLRVSQILIKDQRKVLTFNKDGGRYIGESMLLSGNNSAGEYIEVQPDSILYVNVEKTDYIRLVYSTVMWAVAIAGLFLVIALAMKQSCPFVYTYDGERYHFDAEPLGGATCQALERTEYSELESVKEDNGELKMMVRNEVEETQYVDEMNLIAVAHQPGKRALPDLDGKFYQIENPVSAVFARDEDGRDLTRLMKQDDKIYWMTKLPVDRQKMEKGVRHELIFTFPKPEDSDKTLLVSNIGTSLWGSKMIREMLQLYGVMAGEYYDRINKKGEDYERLMKFIEDEELYKIKYYIKCGGEWKFRGFINGGGPLLTETRVYPVDLSGVSGETVEIKFNPPYGFWAFDYLALDYDAVQLPAGRELTPNFARDGEGNDIRKIISGKDGIYQIMPEVGDNFSVSYKPAGKEAGKEISYFLKSTGYYELHLDKMSPYRFTILNRFTEEPGYIVKYSNEKFSEWFRSTAEAKGK